MAFNGQTYRRNKARRSALEYLAQARAYKARVLSGEAYTWEAALIPGRVRCARLQWSVYLSYRRMEKL